MSGKSTDSSYAIAVVVIFGVIYFLWRCTPLCNDDFRERSRRPSRIIEEGNIQDGGTIQPQSIPPSPSLMSKLLAPFRDGRAPPASPLSPPPSTSLPVLPIPSPPPPPLSPPAPSYPAYQPYSSAYSYTPNYAYSTPYIYSYSGYPQAQTSYYSSIPPSAVLPPTQSPVLQKAAEVQDGRETDSSSTPTARPADIDQIGAQPNNASVNVSTNIPQYMLDGRD